MKDNEKYISLKNENLKDITGGYNKMAGELGADFRKYGPAVWQAMQIASHFI